MRLGSHPCSKQHSCWCAASSAPYRRALPLPRPTYPVRTQVDSYCKDTSQRIVGYYQANELADDVKEGKFDIKIIGYVALPALVLIGQLFFTFSRDALGDAALGPAIMDLYVP